MKVRTKRAKTPDWAAIRAQFEAGQQSIRSIAREHRLSDVGIGKRARRDGWVRKPPLFGPFDLSLPALLAVFNDIETAPKVKTRVAVAAMKIGRPRTNGGAVSKRLAELRLFMREQVAEAEAFAKYMPRDGDEPDDAA